MGRFSEMASKPQVFLGQRHVGDHGEDVEVEEIGIGTAYY